MSLLGRGHHQQIPTEPHFRCTNLFPPISRAERRAAPHACPLAPSATPATPRRISAEVLFHRSDALAEGGDGCLHLLPLGLGLDDQLEDLGFERDNKNPPGRVV